MANAYSKGLEYVPKIPKFLQQLSDKHTPKVQQPSFSEGEEDDNELLGEDAPQIVVLKKRHLTKEQASEALGLPQTKIDREKFASKDTSSLPEKDTEDLPSVDQAGRLLFKKGIKPSSSSVKKPMMKRPEGYQQEDDDERSDEPALKKTKRRNKGKNKITLSFDIQD